MTHPETLFYPCSETLLPNRGDLPPASPALDLTEQEIREELRRVIASGDFPATPRNRKFLSHAVEHVLLNGSAARRVTAHDIATKVFGRRETFDPIHDPIVRIEAARLRKDLETYYLKSGRRSRLRIEIPRGGYDAVFVRVPEQEDIEPEAQPVTGIMAEDAATQLRRIIASTDFPATPRNRKFLSYVVEKELDGLSDEVSARFIGMRVFERGTAFDPNKDPIVRIEAGKLRRDLEVYYLKSGRHDPLHISIPKGRYRPVFAYRV